MKKPQKQTLNGPPKKSPSKLKWIPTPKEAEYIKQNYGRMTKAAVVRRIGCSVNDFDKYIRLNHIKADWTPENKTKDLTGWVRVPVPGIGNPVILVPPHRDPEKARLRYIEKLNRKK